MTPPLSASRSGLARLISLGLIIASLQLQLVDVSPLAAAETDLIEVADGVYAWLQPAPNRFNDSNSLIVVTERDVIVVDAQADPATVESLHAAITELTNLPISWLVNTHWHTDHTQGNAVWRRLVGDGLRIAGHESLSADVPTRARSLLDEQIERLRDVLPRAEANLANGQGLAGQELDEQQQETQRQAIEQGKRQLAALEATELVAPDVTYRNVLRLQRQTGDVVLLHLPGHTAGDTVVWLPEQRVLATGDLLDEVPFGGHGTPSEIVRSLDHLPGYFPAVVVPGHGDLQRSDDRLELVHELWSTLLAHCRERQRAGKTLDEARTELDLSDLRTRMTDGDAVAERNFDGFLDDNFARAWADVSDTLDSSGR